MGDVLRSHTEGYAEPAGDGGVEGRLGLGRSLGMGRGLRLRVRLRPRRCVRLLL